MERFEAGVAGVRPLLEKSQSRLDVRKKKKKNTFSLLVSYRPQLEKFDKSLLGHNNGVWRPGAEAVKCTPQATGPDRKFVRGYDHQSGANSQFFCKAHLYGCAEQLRRRVWYVREGMEEGREW
jgi:hypothetical protein